MMSITGYQPSHFISYCVLAGLISQENTSFYKGHFLSLWHIMRRELCFSTVKEQKLAENLPALDDE